MPTRTLEHLDWNCVKTKTAKRNQTYNLPRMFKTGEGGRGRHGLRVLRGLPQYPQPKSKIINCFGSFHYRNRTRKHMAGPKGPQKRARNMIDLLFALLIAASAFAAIYHVMGRHQSAVSRAGRAITEKDLATGRQQRTVRACTFAASSTVARAAGSTAAAVSTAAVIAATTAPA